MGLVKRAQKEIANGQGPTVHEETDGAVVGCFADGVQSTLPPGKPLKDGACSCGASSICRHRLATVLVYVQDVTCSAETRDSVIKEASDAAQQVFEIPLAADKVEAVMIASSALAEVSEEELSAFLGRRLYDKAAKLKMCTQARVESPGLVHLDTCSVRFLSGQRLEFARCDCRAAGACEHLALAFWALRGTLSSGPAPVVALEAMDPALDLVCEIIEHGVSYLGQGLGSRFEEARRLLLRRGMTWPHDLLEEIEAELGYYQSRGGRYRISRLAHCATSLWARRQTSSNDPSLAYSALGLNRAPETSLRQVRLTGLGCRVEKEETQYYLADSANGKVFVLNLSTGYRPSGLSPFGLAAGQLISAAAHRRANGMLRLGRGPHSLASCGNWDHLSSLQGPPPSADGLLGECHAAPDVRILPVQEVLSGYYSPGQQELSLVIGSTGGLTARLTLAHRSASPFALECLWQAREGLRAAAGVMQREGYDWLMRPTALLCHGVVRVPDLAEDGNLDEAPLGQITAQEDPLASALETALCCWHEVVHRGLGTGNTRINQAAVELRKVGLERTAGQLESARQPLDWLELAARLEVAKQVFFREPVQEEPQGSRSKAG
jgi:hypothetical protein